MEFLRNDNSFDCLVLQGGYNDLLLPTFKQKGKLFKFAYDTQIRNNHLPLQASNVALVFLTDAIREIKTLFKGTIVLVKLGCLGENLDSALNKQRKEFNKIIDKVAVNQGIISTDTDVLFDGFLQDKQQSSYCLDNFWAVTIIDKMTNRFIAKRGLHLTIDGVHLNKKGAEIFAGSILEKLNK